MQDPGVTNGIEVEKWIKSSSEKNCLMKPSQDVIGDEGGDIRKKRKLPKLHLKRNMLFETYGNRHPECLELGMTNVDGLKTSGRESGTPSEEIRDQEQHSDSNVCTSTGEEERSIAITNVTELDHDHQVSNVLVINDDHGETVGQPDVSSKDVTNLSLKGKALMEIESRVDNGEGVGKSSLDGISLIKARKTPHCMSKSRTELSGQCNYVESIPCQHDGHRKPKLSKSRSKHVLEMNDEDDGMLASFCQNTAKKRRLQVVKNADKKSCNKQVLETNDEDDVTLASFCQSISKKKRLQVVKNLDQTSPPLYMGSDSVSKRVDQHNDHNKRSSLVKDGEVQTHCSGGLAENVLSDEPNMVDMANCWTDAPQEPMRQPIDHDDDLETSDITLASLLHDKQKKRGQVLTRSGGQPNNLPRVKKRSRSLAKGVKQCCNGRSSKTLSCCEIQSSGTSSMPTNPCHLVMESVSTSVGVHEDTEVLPPGL